MTSPPSASARPVAAAPAERGGGRHAFLVGAGILASRLAGLVRQRVFAHYLGSGTVAGVFSAALRIPNLLQNMLGEGILSSSFIPVYANLLARGERDEADRVAGSVLGLLAAATAVLVGLGLLFTPALVVVITPGLSGAEHALAVRLVRVLFPAMGILVMSAWCLGVLNSHRKFFLSYVAPVLWNAAMIAVMVALGSRTTQTSHAEAHAGGADAGSNLQFIVQLP